MPMMKIADSLRLCAPPRTKIAGRLRLFAHPHGDFAVSLRLSAQFVHPADENRGASQAVCTPMMKIADRLRLCAPH